MALDRASFLKVLEDSYSAYYNIILRYKKRPIKFAALKLLNIFMAIVLNIVFFLVLPNIYEANGGTGFISAIYDPTVGAGYAFYVNLFCSAILTFFFWRELVAQKYSFSKALLRRMLSYSWPILVLGIAGILNQTADKILFPYIYKGSDAHSQLGIYGAASVPRNNDLKILLDQKLNQKTKYLCHQVGRCSNQTAIAAQKSEYVRATTTQPGSENAGEGIYGLKRVRIVPNISDSGFVQLISTGCRKHVVALFGVDRIFLL